MLGISTQKGPQFDARRPGTVFGAWRVARYRYDSNASMRSFGLCCNLSAFDRL